MNDNLLKCIKQISSDDLNCLDKIKECLEYRLEWLEDREPESDGAVYDEWADKTEELNNLIDFAEALIEKKEELDELIEDFQSSVSSYQKSYGGLSRLKV